MTPIQNKNKDIKHFHVVKKTNTNKTEHHLFTI